MVVGRPGGQYFVTVGRDGHDVLEGDAQPPVGRREQPSRRPSPGRHEGRSRIAMDGEACTEEVPGSAMITTIALHEDAGPFRRRSQRRGAPASASTRLRRSNPRASRKGLASSARPERTSSRRLRGLSRRTATGNHSRQPGRGRGTDEVTHPSRKLVDRTHSNPPMVHVAHGTHLVAPCDIATDTDTSRISHR